MISSKAKPRTRVTSKSWSAVSSALSTTHCMNSGLVIANTSIAKARRRSWNSDRLSYS